METDLPFGNIFCFDYDCEGPSADGLIYGYHCVIGRNACQSDTLRTSPANSDVVVSELVEIRSKRLTVIAPSQGIDEIGDSRYFAHGIRSIDDGEAASPSALFDGAASLFESAATLGAAPEIPFGHPAPAARRHVSRGRSSNVDRNRQRSLIQA